MASLSHTSPVSASTKISHTLSTKTPRVGEVHFTGMRHISLSLSTSSGSPGTRCSPTSHVNQRFTARRAACAVTIRAFTCTVTCSRSSEAADEAPGSPSPLTAEDAGWRLITREAMLVTIIAATDQRSLAAYATTGPCTDTHTRVPMAMSGRSVMRTCTLSPLLMRTWAT